MSKPAQTSNTQGTDAGMKDCRSQWLWEPPSEQKTVSPLPAGACLSAVSSALPQNSSFAAADAASVCSCDNLLNAVCVGSFISLLPGATCSPAGSISSM